MNGILIEYEGEDSGIGLLFASKAAVQVKIEKSAEVPTKIRISVKEKSARIGKS